MSRQAARKAVMQWQAYIIPWQIEGRSWPTGILDSLSDNYKSLMDFCEKEKNSLQAHNFFFY
jgi:hypothetical protein